MFKKRKEQKRKHKISNEIRERIIKARSELIDFTRELDKTLVNCTYVDELLDRMWSYDVRPSLAEAITIDRLIERKNEINEVRDECKERIAKYWIEAGKNKENLQKFYDNGVPLFVKFTNLGDGFITYAMCYEMKQYEDGYYSAYIFGSNEKNGHILNFNHYDYSVEQMTEEEFEKDYIMGRLAYSDFDNEKDAVEYDNYLRRLFHGQREII